MPDWCQDATEAQHKYYQYSRNNTMIFPSSLTTTSETTQNHPGESSVWWLPGVGALIFNSCFLEAF